jgi:hypothetical protein
VEGRELAFSDVKVVKFVNENFVAVAGDDWYQRRRRDAEGEFFRKVADQGPHKGFGGSTRQGIYVLTASGRLLGFNNRQDAASVYALLRRGYFSWRRQPPEDRQPGAVTIADPDRVDGNYHRQAPPGGLVLNVYTRVLDRTPSGELCPGSCEFPGGHRSARDHLWLTEADWKALIPAEPRQGDVLPVPDRVARRIARFHLVDNTRGEPAFWERRQVHAAALKLTVEEAGAKLVRLRIDGSFLLANAADPLRAKRGFDARLLGYIRYDVAKQTISHFDLLAVGNHWGEGPYTPMARPGRAPLGIAFELSRGEAGADRIPPQAARDWQDYLQP